MLSSKCLQAVMLAVAGIGLGVAPANDAAAGSCRSDRSYHDRPSHHDRGVSRHDRYGSQRHDSQRPANVSYRNDNVRFSVSIGSGRHYDSHQPRYRSQSTCNKTVVVYNPPKPCGYWSRVYHSPVYETRYDDCGRPYRVCVRAGYYERVWIATGSRY